MGHLIPRAVAAPLVSAVLIAASGGVWSLDAQKPPRPGSAMVPIRAGSYLPLYRPPTRASDAPDSTPPPAARRRAVAAFEMDVYPVTNAQFLEFVRARPEWRRSRASRLFTDAAYLSHWAGDLELGPGAPANSPVVNVSWFAARAYLKAQGKDLPTVDQWEYAAAASEIESDASRTPAFLARLRGYYAQPVPERWPTIGSGLRNVFGVSDLHGLVWEWPLDFNSAMVTGESRADGSLERTLYCGSAAINAADFENYPAFMRYALRSSLEARYALGSLGFRGVRAIGSPTP
jgi:formylglycine-generating enzyme required for sulfatase activity